MTITIIGTGFVGVVSAAVYASQGNQVIGLDIDPDKINKLKNGQVPFYEPDLKELLIEQQKNHRLTFTTSYQEAISQSEIIIIAVGTPSAPDETADLRYVMKSGDSLAPYLTENAIVAIKSTVPPGTLEKLTEVIKAKSQVKFYGASLPEFLREGSAVYDTLHPSRIVIGAASQFVFDKLDRLHRPFNAPIVHCSVASAQMGKYTANTYLATRITFINEIANLCQKNGADIEEVIQIIGLDQRIGQHYWYPGLGYGGSCFPKDVKELAAYSRTVGEEGNLMNKVNEINKQRIFDLLNNFEEKVDGFANKQVAVLGLSFKPNTDDMREAPSTKVIPFLISKGAQIKSYDPMANYVSFTAIKDEAHEQVASIEEAIKGADAIFLLIEWPEIIKFPYPDYKEAKPQTIFDCRNQLDRTAIKQAGYQYVGIGRS
ncbi:UDP-glucose/GDP-mannose dehydrogenase family protein [Candidatus Woesebacteria bacterium]|jgi:UDPglucose 6-dehydrogenase|nr:UDP-glucose/GDP-mannose dehydrogenase family protein [Candidatus Woesebacteria bacterium]HOA11983.1 UDP-glucose/GDP-mannose dehydrogenase family protein [Candidatus Woesebacteria bacterium]HOC07336.1 UDP-glucose/GDP-mannose dehydrogenase family protein [Candidatus Woesebacteria bacterium]HOI05255.1 UDP-glucose/GDP-mannose dehydrogenase family protein [Candidatus Woesebacteria bacterium]HOP39078.1 UDP-glucose/GDP-mannose dehydrogenase family protein [Candidatus Woesebacteria bacterium]